MRASFEKSLADLQTDYVDLFLIHWPLPMHYGGDFVSTYKVLEDLADDGRARSIGVSNFQPHHLDALAGSGCRQPAVNQVEVHPYFTNLEVVNFCKGAHIQIESWAPLARGRVLRDPLIGVIAEELGVTPAQVVIAWHLAKGYVTFPKCSSAERQAENFAALDVHLTLRQIERIDELNRGESGRTGMHPDRMDRLDT